MKSAVLKALCGALILAFSSMALATPLPTIIGGVFGVDGNASSWKLQDVTSVSLQGGSVTSLSVPGQIICPHVDVNTATHPPSCGSNFYWMVYQIPGSNLPNLKLSITGLTCFTFNGANLANDTKFGVLQCGAGVTTATALCTNLTAGQINGLQLDAEPDGSGLDIILPNGLGGATPLSVFVAVSDSNFTSHGIAAALLSVDPTPPQANKYVLPHVLSGGGYVTKITVVNTSTSPANGQVNFITQSGGFVTSSAFTLNPGGTFRLQTDEADRFKNVTVNWAWVGSDQPLGVNLFFEFNGGNGQFNITNSVGFNPPPLLTDFTVPAEFEPPVPGSSPGRTTGLAIANPNPTAGTVTLNLLDYLGFSDNTLAMPIRRSGRSSST